VDGDYGGVQVSASSRVFDQYRQLEFDFGLWTRKIIRELIRREFGVKLSEVQVGRLLNKIGLSPQRPLYRAYQQDPERVAEWKKSAYPKIRKLAAKEGASIFFADEASIRTDHHAGTTWAPVGRTPVVSIQGWAVGCGFFPQPVTQLAAAGSQGLPASAWVMASRAVRPWLAAESR